MNDLVLCHQRTERRISQRAAQKRTPFRHRDEHRRESPGIEGLPPARVDHNC